MKTSKLGSLYPASAALLATLVLVFAATGCASKKYVRETVDPVNQRVGEVDKKTTENASAIDELETGVSKTNERVLSVEQRAEAVGQEAARANERAGQAGEQAGAAQKAADVAMTTARQGLSQVDSLQNKLFNLREVAAESVHFKFDSDKLDEEAKAVLDEAAGNMANLDHYVVEVQGFTDKTGSSNYNLELSRRRASAVVRYLTLQHKIPLHKIHVIGLGSETPVADNKTRDGRQQNRRVEVRLFSAGEAGAQEAGSASLSKK